MNNGIGRALWNIYEDAVRDMPSEAESGVAGATLKFIRAFEQELSNAKIDLYCHSALKQDPDRVAKFRRVTSRKS